ncbi:hypothetical protein [Burkholderia sp. Ac-20365]|uniref:hypothetical protein n=1 Tax=Burkholderia sp. Ac-20365 TaxID=2703897 RepID=UPI00197B7CBD|nr:hypothetical protein [Burkholderia sp. Ac-20365]MBN3760971.1 hypothetical protein [Burkholderia sp. Ac-20365]
MKQQAQIEPVQDLSSRAMKARLDVWSLPRIKDSIADRSKVVGRCVTWGAGGQTTVIVACDPATHRVLTQSGSVYELGMPNIGFAVANPGLMAQVGFGST